MVTVEISNRNWVQKDQDGKEKHVVTNYDSNVGRAKADD